MKPETFPPLAAALSALFILAGGTASASHELELRADLGYDSNVFELNKSVGERDGMFSFLEAALSAEDSSAAGWNIGIDAGAALRLFESSVSDGDEERYFGRVRGDSGGGRRDHVFDWELRHRLNRSTYVSRISGVVATDGAGNEIADRFDNAIDDLRAAWHFPGGAYGRISLEGFASTKNYLTDYASLGLDRLDHTEFGMTPEYIVRGRHSDFRIDLMLALRQYRDRRVSDVNGNPVAGTNLEYRYYGFDARYQYEFTRTKALEFSAEYDVRKDNGIGFDDRTRWNAGVEWTYRPTAQALLAFEVEWSSRVFDRAVTGDPTLNDETPEKKGYRLNVKFVRPFPGVTAKGCSLLAEAWWESFDSSGDERFSYDRVRAFAGIRREF